MAKVMVQHRDSEGAVTTVVLKIANDYPDALAEAKRMALDMLCEAMVSAHVAPVVAAEDDEDA